MPSLHIWMVQLLCIRILNVISLLLTIICFKEWIGINKINLHMMSIQVHKHINKQNQIFQTLLELQTRKMLNYKTLNITSMFWITNKLLIGIQQLWILIMLQSTYRENTMDLSISTSHWTSCSFVEIWLAASHTMHALHSQLCYSSTSSIH